MNLAQDLFAYRVRHGTAKQPLSQDKMCQLLGVSKVAYRWWELGVTKNPKYEHMVKIKKLLSEE